MKYRRGIKDKILLLHRVGMKPVEALGSLTHWLPIPEAPR